LEGKKTIGVYPLLEDDTCWFLAADFDKKGWVDDAAAFLKTCGEMAVPAALERSRSGQGGHAWIFFQGPVQASLARKLGCALLTRTMERRPQLGLDSYDRLFPCQDTVPRGGFGNLIALPLQRNPREEGNSLFLDHALRPHPDQWAFLSDLPRMTVQAAERLVAEASRAGSIVGIRMSLTEEGEEDPWTQPPSRRKPDRPVPGPFPGSVRIVQGSRLFVEKEGLPPALLHCIFRLAAFQNPEFFRAQAMRMPVFGIPRVVGCGEDFLRHVGLPRGCLEDLLWLLESHGIRGDVADERFGGSPLQIRFQGQLRPDQELAVQALLPHDLGILSGTTAFGKTVTAIWMIAARKVSTLVLVHRRQLLDQWRERLAAFLDLPLEEIGQIGGGRDHRTGRVDVAILQSVNRKGEVKDFVAEYGQVVVDECHHVSAVTFEQVLKEVKARYVLGLTATPVRKDGHHPIIVMQCGPIRFRESPRKVAAARPFDHLVIPRETGFRMLRGSAEATIQEIYKAMVADERRTLLVLDDLLKALEAGRSPLLLTQRTEQLEIFARRLQGFARNVIVLQGGMGKRQRDEVARRMAAIPEGEERVLLATGPYIGEGFDDARLDTLFLAMPISWRGTLQQYVGRLHRLHEGKRVVQVYDYVDVHVPMLARMFRRRLEGYTAMGYGVPGSPPPGA
jgi:superfamily II DNA or RNA helicase